MDESSDPLAKYANLSKRSANYASLSPVKFIVRTAAVFPARTAVIYEDTRYNWSELYSRCRRLASSLTKIGVKPGDTVSVFAGNTPPLLEAHYAIPMAGAVLNAINTRLEPSVIALILKLGGAKVLITDREYSATVRAALSILSEKIIVIDVSDPFSTPGERLGDWEYEDFVASGNPDFEWNGPPDEWYPITLSYTSGTTGEPKGVVSHHRGTYLTAVGNVMAWSLTQHPVYLWTLPMFHSLGWCFPWTITAMAGTHVCLRKVDANTIYSAIAKHEVSHFCGAPVIMQMLINAPERERRRFHHKVEMMTAAAPPPASILAAMSQIGIRVTHGYGLTEVNGSAVICAWKEEWDDLPLAEQAAIKARQGVSYPTLDMVDVVDVGSGKSFFWDGVSVGEVVMRGNLVMMGYLNSPTSTDEAFQDGYFHTGDLAVIHADGYIQLRDRLKDIIISGGENISTIEVETILFRHPAVLDAAVVAKPDEKWGETPCAFVQLRSGWASSEEEIVEFCRANLAHFKAPKTVIFGALPKTATGKVQKFALRERVRCHT